MSHGRVLAGACQQCSHTTDTAGPSHRRATPRGSESGLYSSLGGWPPSIAQLDILLIVQTIVTSLPMTLFREGTLVITMDSNTSAIPFHECKTK